MKAVCRFVFLSSVLSQCAFAHEVLPAYLQMRQTASDTFDVLWKVPTRGENLRLGIYVEFPSGCMPVDDPRIQLDEKSLTERWTVACRGGLAGETIRVAGLSGSMTDVLVRLERLDGGAQIVRLTPASPSFVVAASPEVAAVAFTYLSLGVEHILLGMDHLLFVLALLFLVKGIGRLVATITAFTVAHSITLACAVLGFVHVPGPPVEACIALSIVFVAGEMIHGARGQVGIAARWPWIVAFTFGLLHGLGFAGALSEIGLPQPAIPVALLFFNVGVEIGQLLFVTVVLFVVRTLRAVRPAPQWAKLVPPYAIGSMAMFWVFQRIAAFFIPISA